MSFDPSSSVSGENNLSYLNQDNEIKPIVIRARRAPTTNDRRFKIGTLWVDQNTDQSYQITSVSGGQANWVLLGVGAGDLEMLTGDSGGAIFPNGLGNINIVGNDLFTVSGSGNTLTINETTGSFPVTPFVVGPVGQAGYQTVQSALDAIGASGSGHIYVQPGTFTENLVFPDGINVGIITGSDEDAAAAEIVGIHTPPLTGNVVLWRMKMTSTTHIFDSVAAGSAQLVCAHNNYSTDGYIFNLPNWTPSGSFTTFAIGDFLSTSDGIVNNTAGASTFLFQSGLGVGTTNPCILSGFTAIQLMDISTPVIIQGSAFCEIEYSTFFRNLSLTGSSSGYITSCKIESGTDPSITYSTSGDFEVTSVSLTSSNDPCIDGAGAGTLDITGLNFPDNFNIASTLTLASGTIHGGPFMTPFVVGEAPDAPYRTIQSALDAANAAGGGLVYVQAGSFTENLTLYDNVGLEGVLGLTTITGIHTPPSSGILEISNCTLISATHILDSAAAGTTNICIQNCFVILTNGFWYNLPNWTGELLTNNCGEASTQDGFINNVTGTSNIKVLNTEAGAGSTNTMEINASGGGFLRFDTVNINCPVNMLGSGSVIMQNGVKFANNVTIGGSLSGFAIDTNFRGGSAQALTYESSGDFSISNGEIQSTNDPAVGGTGSGDLKLTSCAFSDNSNIASTLTLASSGGHTFSRTFNTITSSQSIGLSIFSDRIVSNGNDLDIPIILQPKGDANVQLSLGSLQINQAGEGVNIAEAPGGGRQGTAVLIAGTVTVATTAVTATSRIFLTSQVDGGTPGFLRVTATTVGTDFTITSSNGADTSTVAWLINEPA